MAADYLAARGGREALASLKAIVREGTVTAYARDGAHQGTYRTCVRYPDMMAVELSAGPVQVAELLVNGQGYVCAAGFRDCQAADPGQIAELKETARIANRELLFETAEWPETLEVSDAGPLRRVTFERRRGSTVYEFDKASGLLARKQIGSRSRVYADWRRVGGITMPFSLVDYEGDQPRLRVQLSRVCVTSALSGQWCEPFLRAQGGEP